MNQEAIKQILKLAEKSYKLDEIPVGCVVVKSNEIIGMGMNNRNSSKNVTGHAEINAILDATKKIGDWRLDNYELYVTLKPCMMCTGAIVDSRINKVYYLCDRTNVCFDCAKYVKTYKIKRNDIEEQYTKLLQQFFQNKRK